MNGTCRAGLQCRAAALALLLVGGAGCGRGLGGQANGYVPRLRQLTVTTVPLLVKEGRAVYPFLDSAFARGGPLEGKEVYAFSPSTFTVVEGDTIAFTLVNPEDDVHTFVLPDLAVPLPGQQIVHASYVARKAGIYPIVCNVASHLPMMSGQLIVLSPAAVAPGR